MVIYCIGDEEMIEAIEAVDKFLVGIYKITNVQTNKCYVGKSIDVRSRLKTHYRELTNNDHHNYLLQHDFNLYGESAFNISVLHECKSEELDDFESYFCHGNDVWNTGYNIAKLKPTAIRPKTKFEKIKEEFVDYLSNLNSVIQAVNQSTKDIIVERWKLAESSGLEEKVVKRIIDHLTTEDFEKIPFVIKNDAIYYPSYVVVFRSKEREEELDRKLYESFLSMERGRS